ncbi:MAG: hypothetical protein AMJ88_13525 [Anaerolineae bacterium SM23_ 63]|nr:MAG: hypothetical protein AMJ88_13525 [Anaerolineae bacterium SM23_ 63]
MGRKRVIASAQRMNQELNRVFYNLGTKDQPKGKILSAYRQAHRSIQTAIEHNAINEIGEIMGLLELAIGETTRDSLERIARVGYETGRTQLEEYKVDPVEWEDPGIALMQDMWMNHVRDQSLRSRALLIAGGDPALLIGDVSRQGIIRPGPTIQSGARWLSMMGSLAWAKTVGQSTKRPGVKVEFKRQAIASIDRKTTDCCLQVHGQIVGLEEFFTLIGTPRYADEIKDPPFHDYCRTSQALIRPDEVGDDLTQAMESAARAELDAREQDRILAQEIREKLVKLGVEPDGRVRAGDSDEVKRLRGELTYVNKRVFIKPGSALARRPPPKHVWKPVKPPPKGEPPTREELLAAPLPTQSYAGWQASDKDEAQRLAKNIRRHRRKLEKGQITQEQFDQRAGDLIKRHQKLSEKYGENSRFLNLVGEKPKPPSGPLPSKLPLPSGIQPDRGEIRASFGEVKEAAGRIKELEGQTSRAEKDFIAGKISEAEFNKIFGKNAIEVARLRKVKEKSLAGLLKLPEGVKGVKFSPEYSWVSHKEIRKLNKAIKELEERIVERKAGPFGLTIVKGARGSWDGWNVTLGSANRRTLHHELGHMLEARDPVLRRIVRQWRLHRTRGEKVTPLGGGYGEKEIAKKDKFVEAYIGRIYKSQDTEVVSMGLELLLHSPALLMKDSEHFDLMVNVLRGTELEWAREQPWFKE